MIPDGTTSCILKLNQISSNFSYAKSGITFLSSLAILYTALFVPVQLSIWSSNNACNQYPLLRTDVFVDCWFMFEFLIRGFVGEYVNGKYVDDMWLLLALRASNYAETIVDVISAFPFSVVSFWLLLVYC